MILVGLGNPGDRYRDTRHNVGYHLIDFVAERWGQPAFRSKFQGRIALAEHHGAGESQKVILLKPETFMNRSGDSVQPVTDFFKHRPQDVLVVHDEIDLPLGQLRLKQGGGTGGHNGLKSVTQRLGTDAYARLRLGIGRPPEDFRGSVADFVLQAVPPSEAPAYKRMLADAADAVELLLEEGMSAAMNRVNRRS